MTVPVRWALAHLVGVALADALPLFCGCCCLDERSCGGGGAGAVGTGAPSGSGVGRRTPLFPGCYCAFTSAAVEVAVLVR